MLNSSIGNNNAFDATLERFLGPKDFLFHTTLGRFGGGHKLILRQVPDER